jgi:hypothetical protein
VGVNCTLPIPWVSSLVSGKVAHVYTSSCSLPRRGFARIGATTVVTVEQPPALAPSPSWLSDVAALCPGATTEVTALVSALQTKLCDDDRKRRAAPGAGVPQIATEGNDSCGGNSLFPSLRTQAWF